ncbi:Flagellar basal body rod FlgEFG protein C-terminal [Paracoccus chinensis]|uniref:Flagellar basal body rod FlgEFG protein C-terminal n=2 Tax=Paracoccus chinensis TaxID=525640 RepID=A0A1G9C8D8_9RHOB|nr:Flagellar basal body rod FlgEFG protein C-terminal [Paracoccus chinensis]
MDGLSEIVPIKELPRENGKVALFTATGGTLLDGTAPARFEFSPVPVMTAEAVGAPALGLLRLNGEEIPPAQMGRFAGGRLAANFQIRDLDGPGAQASLDAAARDIHDRFAAGPDPTLPPGAPGLFTDPGGAATAVPGLAQRLTVNAAADPAAGGALWRVRDGLQASAPGPVGNADLLLGMHEALGALRPSSLAGMSPVPRSAATLAADLSSWAASGRIEAERVLGGATAQSATFEAMRQQDGVDSDREMETLLALERAYASNAKVLQAVDEMLQTMLRLT